MELLEAVTAEQPDNAEAFYNLGVALKQRDDFDRAEAALRRAVTLAPQLGDPPFTLGVLLWQTGRSAEAEQMFREAIARDARLRRRALHARDGAEGRRAAPTRRSPSCAAAIRLRPDSIEAHQSLAQLLQQRGDADGARLAREEADRLARRKADAQASAFALSVGRQKLKAGDRPAAIAQFREAIRLAPDNAEAHYALGVALQQAGAAAEARAALRTGAEARAPPLSTRGTSVIRPLRPAAPPLLILAAASAWPDRCTAASHRPRRSGLRLQRGRVIGRPLGRHRLRRHPHQPLPARDHRHAAPPRSTTTATAGWTSSWSTARRSRDSRKARSRPATSTATSATAPSKT